MRSRKDLNEIEKMKGRTEMKGLKKIIVGLCVLLMVGEPLGVKAEEQIKTIACNNETMVYSHTDLLEVQELPQNVGESIKIGEDENGGLWVTLIDKTQNITRSNTLTDVHTYMFTYTDFWGNEKDGFEVRLECDWVKAGEDSHIIELRGSYNVIASVFSCKWSDSSYSQCVCWLELDVTKSGETNTLRFIASVVPFEGGDDLHFGVI
jgi:hypothetical protein